VPSFRRAAGLSLVLAAAVTAPAQAAITSSQITSSDVARFDYRYALVGVAADNTRTVSGTAVGAAGDTVQVHCLHRGQSVYMLGETTLAANGTWTVEGPITGLSDPCVLRALPAAPAPGADLTPFLPTGELHLGEVTTSAENGKLFDWSVDDEPRKHGFADYYSLGSCGLCDVQWRNDAGELSEYLWYYNASTGALYEWDEDGAGPNPAVDRPLATVDGMRAYAPENAQDHGGPARPGFVPLTFEHEVDQETGDSTTRSTEALMTCPQGCGTDVTDTGIRVDRTTVNTRDGQVFRIEDVWRNTAGAARDVELNYMNSQEGDVTGVELPGESGFSARRNEIVDLADADAATITVKNRNGNPIDPLDNPVGTLTMAPSAEQAVFTDSTSEFLLRHDLALAPGESTTITQVYAMGGTLEDTRALGAEAEDELAAPKVAIGSPADGSTVDTDSVAVSGTASDTVGVSSVKVNGVAATVDGGGWSATVPLKPGANTLQAIATDGAGNTASASRTVIYTPKAAPAVARPPVVLPLPRPLLAVLRDVGRAKASGKGNVLVDTGLDVSCPAGGPACTADVSATAPLPVKAKKKKKKSKKASAAATKRRRVTIGKRTMRIPAGATHRIRLRLSPAASRELRRRGSLTIALRIALRVGNAAATTTRRTITVKAPARKKKA
jgi:hypothetical protein